MFNANSARAHCGNEGAHRHHAGLSRDSTIYDIDLPVIQVRGRAVLSPDDGRPGAAYVNAIDPAHTGRPTFMLSYTWACVLGCDVAVTVTVLCDCAV